MFSPAMINAMGDISLRAAYAEYLTGHLPARNLSPRTRVEYTHDIRDLVNFLDEMGIRRVGEVGLVHLERYLSHLVRKGLTGHTRKRKVITIRTFFAYLQRCGYVQSNVARQLIPPFVKSRPPRILSSQESACLCQVCRSNPRDYFLIEFLLNTGVRIGELCKIILNDIDLPALSISPYPGIGYVRIAGMTGISTRTLPLSGQVISAFQEYLRIRKPTNSQALFVNHFGNPLGPRGIQKIVQKLFIKAGINEADVQALRNTYGAKLALRGASNPVIERALGIKDIRNSALNIVVEQIWLKTKLCEFQDDHQKCLDDQDG